MTILSTRTTGSPAVDDNNHNESVVSAHTVARGGPVFDRAANHVEGSADNVAPEVVVATIEAPCVSRVDEAGDANPSANVTAPVELVAVPHSPKPPAGGLGGVDNNI